MPLQPGCTRCSVRLEDDRCPEHGAVPPLWRPEAASASSFSEHLSHAADFPTYLRWPMEPGWKVADFAAVGPPERVQATLTALAGTSAEDGDVQVLVVTEEPGTGLGARIAGTPGSDPGEHLSHGRPMAQVKVGPHAVKVWHVPTAAGDGVLDRIVLAGEAAGRWLWLVLRPATAVLMLTEPWELADASGFRAVPYDGMFGGRRPEW